MFTAMTYGRLLLLALLVAGNAFADGAGTVSYVEGAVFLQDELVQVNDDVPVVVTGGQTLRTEQGNAELYVTAGALLRLGADSNVEIVNADASSISVRLVSGSIVVGVSKAKKSGPVTVLLGESTTTITSKGEYRFDFADEGPSALQVRKGKATITDGDGDNQLKKKQAAAITSQGIAVASFDDFAGDQLTSWHEKRSEVVLAEVYLSRRDSLNVGGLPGDGTTPSRRPARR
jgi:ferric-dicitrate binding protein FerR (iron transport regulator)